ncbi:unnamed protein product [Symbiodinium necroappetens]|uniref:GAR domain-containing protein n=1 Tax=Symbiodinium necroappetens TaxID=1628268 RepID=A0A813AYK9_9DINO|nr:unnamed protein product [Symbiodinium necroappetens]
MLRKADSRFASQDRSIGGKVEKLPPPWGKRTITNDSLRALVGMISIVQLVVSRRMPLAQGVRSFDPEKDTERERSHSASSISTSISVVDAAVSTGWASTQSADKIEGQPREQLKPAFELAWCTDVSLDRRLHRRKDEDSASFLGLQQRQDAERSQNALISRVEQLSSGKLQAEQQMREAQSEMHWLRGELARCHRHARSEVQSLQGPLDEGHHLDNGTPDVEQPSLRHASWSPPKQPASSPPSPARHRARASPAHSVDVHCSPPNGSGMSRSSSYKGSSYEPAPHTDEVDEMWRTVLQRFPQHPQWCLVKEKRCVYRMGSQTGKKIVCRVTHGGLQVRVGGGWMAAFPFLERYGPLNMGQKGEDMQYNCTSVDLPPSMERLLVPTKSWAQRIGISKTPDLREQRRLQVDEEDASEAGRPRSMSKRAWSATAPAERLASIPQGLPALDGDGLAQALQPLPWPGHTRSRQTEECRKL